MCLDNSLHHSANTKSMPTPASSGAVAGCTESMATSGQVLVESSWAQPASSAAGTEPNGIDGEHGGGIAHISTERRSASLCHKHSAINRQPVSRSKSFRVHSRATNIALLAVASTMIVALRVGSVKMLLHAARCRYRLHRVIARLSFDLSFSRTVNHTRR